MYDKQFINELFFELVRVSVGTAGCLSHSPRSTSSGQASADEWGELYTMAKKQSLVGVCFAGVQKLYNDNANDDDNHNRSNTSNLSELQYLTWLGMAAKIQQRNEIVNRQCTELQAKLSSDGFRCCVLKGQGVGQLYSEPLR